MILVWTAPARADLRSIDAWPTREASGDVSARVLDTIRYRANFIQDFPRAGHRSPDLGFRISPVSGTPYLILYRFMGDRIEILRVRHERENWQTED